LGRYRCDAIFPGKMYASCRSRYAVWNPLRWRCYGIANRYYIGVRLFGAPAFTSDIQQSTWSTPIVSHRPADNIAGPRRFSVLNFVLGAVVSGLLVGVLGYGTILLAQANTPEDQGVNIGGALLATVGTLLAIMLGSALTTWRARRRNSQPLSEGVAAGLAGLMCAVVTAGYVMFLARGVPFLEVFSMLPLLGFGVGAAFAGTILGGWRPRDDPSLANLSRRVNRQSPTLSSRHSTIWTTSQGGRLRLTGFAAVSREPSRPARRGARPVAQPRTARLRWCSTWKSRSPHWHCACRRSRLAPDGRKTG
jgi:hypothetical protein